MRASSAQYRNRVTLSNVLNGKAGVTASFALRLAAWLGTSPEMWVGMQAQWDLWQAQRTLTTACGTTNEYRPSILMCSCNSGDSRARSASVTA